MIEAANKKKLIFWMVKIDKSKNKNSKKKFPKIYFSWFRINFKRRKKNKHNEQKKGEPIPVVYGYYIGCCILFLLVVVVVIESNVDHWWGGILINIHNTQIESLDIHGTNRMKLAESVEYICGIYKRVCVCVHM